MKKLLLILSAVLVSVMAWAASLNPYAYDLSSEWNEATCELTIRFKLNAHPNMTVNNSGRGIQIHAVDPSNGNKMYYICGIPGDYINSKIDAKSLDYEYTIPIKGITLDGKDILPSAKNLTWAVTVQGLNTEDQSAPVVVNTGVSDDYRPFSCHGIAINKDQNSKDFGAIYVTEASEGTDNGLWKWIKDQNKGRSLLKYTPRLDQVEAYRKFAADGITQQNFSLRNGYDLLEPHKVRISDDGRIFVSSYNRNTSNDKVVVWEFDKNTKQFKPIISHNTNYGHRVCAMDVKGSGNNLKILLCYFSEDKKYNSTFQYAFAAYEYSITSSNTYPISTGAKRILYQPGMGSSLTDYTYGQGVLDWTHGKQKSTDPNPNTSNGYFYSDGLVNIAYGKTNNTDIFFAFDYFYSSTFNTRTMYYKNCTPNNAFFSGTVDYHTMNESNHYLGGAGFLTYKDGSNEYLVAGHAKNYLIANNAEGDGRVQVYPFDRSQSDDNISYTAKWTVNTKTKACINDMAMDHANNIYAISFSDGTSTTPGTGRIVAIAMPYDGTTTTIAPSSNYFSIPPVPNIYATNLRYEAVEGAPKYKFSFNVNTKPKYAEIRFYKSYESMKKSLSVVNADDFNGGQDNRDADLYCYYPITSGLKCGKIEVEFDMVGGVINNKLLTYPKLPRGQLYWSVYVETDKSAAFAPIYRQPLTGADAHYQMHAIVNDNPETDQFGAIYGAQEDNSTAKQSLMIYEISDNGSDVHNINNTTRYTKKQEYLYNTSDAVYKATPRRMAIAPDGTVYIAHEGAGNQNSADQRASWQYGGIYAWNPNEPTQNGKLKLSKFSNNGIGTSSAVALYGHVNGNDTTWKMYAANSYGEFPTHGSYYTPANQRDVTKFGWNGFVEYDKDKAANWSSWVAGANHEYQLKQGDGSGNSSLVAMDKGVWICQHREHSIDVKIKTAETFADNRGSLVLSFVPYGNYTVDAVLGPDWGPRTWRSSTTDGGRTKNNEGKLTIDDKEVKSELTQKDGAILQATPGAGMAYRKINGVDYLFINNHDGNIVQLQVDWKASTTPATPEVHVSKAKVLTTPSDVKGTLSVNGNKSVPWKTAAISSMSFDFAGNLVTTTGVSYLKLTIPQLLSGDEDKFKTPEGGQSIIIYTMPYDRTNAREIQAPKSNIFIPERLAQLNMTVEDIQNILTEHNDHGSQCYIDLYRPMQGGMFNTFCVPFKLNTTLIPQDHPLYGAEIRRFTGVTLSESGGEKILTLNFENLSENTMAANVPHIIKPQSNIKSIIPFDWLQVLAKDTEVKSPYFNFDNGNRITYQGILPKTPVDALYDPNTNLPLRLILVADNRLAALTGNGEMYGFRGYFDLAQPLPPGTVAKISAKKDTPTNTTIVVDGKKVNIDKYLREGRVYIRVGDSLYTVDGQLVK